MNDKLTFRNIRNIAALWLVSLAGWLLSIIGKSLCDLSIPFRKGSEKVMMLGEKIIQSDEVLKETYNNLTTNKKE